MTDPELVHDTVDYDLLPLDDDDEPTYPHQHCPECGDDEWLMDVPNDPEGRIWCGKPVHGDNPPVWNPWL